MFIDIWVIVSIVVTILIIIALIALKKKAKETIITIMIELGFLIIYQFSNPPSPVDLNATLEVVSATKDSIEYFFIIENKGGKVATEIEYNLIHDGSRNHSKGNNDLKPGSKTYYYPVTSITGNIVKNGIVALQLIVNYREDDSLYSHKFTYVFPNHLQAKQQLPAETSELLKMPILTSTQMVQSINATCDIDTGNVASLFEIKVQNPVAQAYLMNCEKRKFYFYPRDSSLTYVEYINQKPDFRFSVKLPPKKQNLYFIFLHWDLNKVDLLVDSTMTKVYRDSIKYKNDQKLTKL